MAQQVQMTREQAVAHFTNQIRLLDEGLIANRVALTRCDAACKRLSSVGPVSINNIAVAVTAIVEAMSALMEAQAGQLRLMTKGQEEDRKKALALIAEIQDPKRVVVP